MPTPVSGSTRKVSGKPLATAKKRVKSQNPMESVLQRRNRHLEEENERLRETLEVLSSRKSVQRIQAASKRLDRGEFLTEEDVWPTK